MQNYFLSEIHDLLFSVSYGIAKVIINRNQIPTGGLSGDQNAISFGQPIPLLLIALPVLAAGEVYFQRHDEVESSPSPLQTFIGQLDPATLLLQDDADATVAISLEKNVMESNAGLYIDSVGPFRQIAGQMTSSAAGERRPNATIITAQGRDEESIAAAAASDEDILATRRAATQSGVHQMTPPTKPTWSPKTPLKKAKNAAPHHVPVAGKCS
ncbi:MAG: hypothetical protein ASARMPREDX12_004752 [Alectoria sarmentosa]|nr:MAG: hypothetical protein ASARMPREDX12_004752 [Alectoria sarmentosa]